MTDSGSKKKLSSGQRFFVGALLATAFFFVEAGVAQIVLAGDIPCQEAIGRLRIEQDPEVFCMPELETRLLEAASKGIAGFFLPNAPTVGVWLLMGTVYAIIGGLLGQLSARWGITIFFLSHIALLAVTAGLGFLSKFIVWGG